jgi:large subunit ribosomal protein L19
MNEVIKSIIQLFEIICQPRFSYAIIPFRGWRSAPALFLSTKLKVRKMAHAVDLIQSVEYQSMQQVEERPTLRPGDTVNVHVRIVEGNRERVQVFQGVVIAVRGGGINKFFVVRRIAAHGIGVERIFPYYSPRIEKIEVLRHAAIRRSKLYYLRSRSGKSARLKEKRLA